MATNKKTLWILEDHFSQNWGIDLEAVEAYIRGKSEMFTERCEEYDEHMVKIVGNEPAQYGYIVLEPDDRDDDTIIIGCRTMEDYDFTYSQICDAIINHPHCIDLRGVDLIFG